MNDARPLGKLHAWAVAAVATTVMSVSYIDRQTLAALAPTVKKALDIDHTQYGLLTSAFSIAYLVGAPPAGAMIDALGARRGLVVAVLAWSAVAALHAIVPGFGALFALRVLLGLTEAPSFPAATQSIRRVLPPESRSAGFGLLFTGSSIGSMIAAPLAVRLSKGFGWRAAFVGTALVGLAWVPLWVLASASPGARARLDLSDGSARPARGGYGGLLVEPAVWRALAVIAASAPGIMFVLNWLPQLMVDARGMTQEDVGSYAWMPPVLFDAGALAFGWLASRRDAAAGPYGHRGLLAVAAALASLLALLPLVDQPVPLMLVAGAAMAGGAGMYVLATADLLARVAPTRTSSASGLCAAAQSLMHVVVNPLMGRWLDRTHDYGPVLVTLGLLAIPGALAFGAIRPAPRAAA